MQSELFDTYTQEEIEAAKQQLAADVVKLADLKEEKAETSKGYSDAIKVLQMQIDNRARMIKRYGATLDKNVTIMMS